MVGGEGEFLLAHLELVSTGTRVGTLVREGVRWSCPRFLLHGLNLKTENSNGRESHAHTQTHKVNPKTTATTTC